jgi:hypothetical protein
MTTSARRALSTKDGLERVSKYGHQVRPRRHLIALAILLLAKSDEFSQEMKHGWQTSATVGTINPLQPRADRLMGRLTSRYRLERLKNSRGTRQIREPTRFP